MTDGFGAFDEREAKIESAARSIVALCRDDQFGRGWRPKGVDEVAILLESLGYSPEIVAELWYPSLFDFAADVSRVVDRYVTDQERAEQVDINWFVRACRDYAVGALYSGPWIIAVIGLAVFGAALWSSLSTPLHLATAIALGVYGALVLSGAFSQAIARRLTFYFLQDNAALMLWTLDRFIAISVGTFVLVGVVGWLILRAMYGDLDAWLAASFFIGSGIFQTSLAPLYTLRKFAWIIAVSLFAALVTGVTFLVFFHREVSLPFEPATLAIEIALIGLAVMIATVVWMRRRANAAGGSRDLVPPTWRAIGAAAAPYATFGAAYFLMIVVDHIAAGLTHGFPFSYRSGYELGCDLGLVAIIPVVGVINVMLENLPRRILAGAASGIEAGAPFDRAMLRFYLIGALGVFLATALTVALAETVGIFVLEHTVLGLGGAAGVEAAFVLRYATVGYGLLMLGLLNCQLLFFLSRPFPAVAASLAGATIVALGSMYVVIFHQPAASCVFALDAGIFTFLAITTIATLRTMSRFTYSYYAAY